MGYVCTCCGQTHDGLPDLAFDQPAYARDVPENERETRVQLGTDLCVVDDEFYFIRGVIEIPLRGSEEKFGIGAWVSQKASNFQTYVENYDTPDIGPFFGWLSNNFLYCGAQALNLKTMVHFRGQGKRPSIELEPIDHPLAVAQRDGLTLEETWNFVHGASG